MARLVISSCLVALAASIAAPGLAWPQEPACVEPPAGLIGWWPGNDSADDIVGPNDFTLMNGATFGGGMVGSAFKFDGIDDFAQGTTLGLPTGNNDRTLEMWFMVTQFVGDEANPASYGNFGNFGEVYLIFTDPLANRISFSSWGTAVFGPPAETGQWYHVAATNVGDFVRLYVNGARVATGSVPIDTPSGTPFYLARIPGFVDRDRRLKGFVDEVSIYDRALSDAEVEAIYSAGSAGKCRPTPAICAGLSATLVGTPSNDVLVGTAGPDVIAGLKGDDRIEGRGGNDVICGGPVFDTVLGGSGNDKLRGETGNDALDGGFGADVLLGGPGDDVLEGAEGTDRLDGGDGTDNLDGGPDGDVLLGGAGNDLLKGRNGNDKLFGNADDDTLDGGVGIDQCAGGSEDAADTAVNCESVSGVP